jgi:FkbM family methyltransferase
MIIFNELTEDRKGIRFSSSFKEDKRIEIRVIDSYTGLVAWSDLMTIGPGMGYFFSYPVSSRYITFEILDSGSQELLLRTSLFYEHLPSIEDFDLHGRLKNYKYEERDKDLWAAYPLYDIFINKCYKKDVCSVQEGDVVFDIGSNLGLFSYHAVCEGARKVYSFEPGVPQYKSIVENFGSMSQISIENLAVSDLSGEIIFYVHPTLSIMSSTSLDKDGFRSSDGYIKTSCKSVNLHEYCLENAIEKIDYLKMDCEGAEYKIVESLPENFLSTSVSKICMEYHDNKDNKVQHIVDKLLRCGFSLDRSDIIEGQEVGILYGWK